MFVVYNKGHRASLDLIHIGVMCDAFDARWFFDAFIYTLKPANDRLYNNYQTIYHWVVSGLKVTVTIFVYTYILFTFRRLEIIRAALCCHVCYCWWLTNIAGQLIFMRKRYTDCVLCVSSSRAARKVWLDFIRSTYQIRMHAAIVYWREL